MPEKRRPGRPRKLLPGPEDGHTTGTADPEGRMNNGERRSATGLRPGGLVVQVAPRLLDLEAAATYLSLSVWTIRDLEHSGFLPRVRIPMSPEAQRRPRNGRNGAGGGEIRKLLFDRQDLDECVERWKERATP